MVNHPNRVIKKTATRPQLTEEDKKKMAELSKLPNGAALVAAYYAKLQTPIWGTAENN